MQDILAILQEYTRSIVNGSAVALANWEAATADADALAQAVEKREAGHREFSLFTPSEGRA